jgi:hypothetical protein
MKLEAARFSETSICYEVTWCHILQVNTRKKILATLTAVRTPNLTKFEQIIRNVYTVLLKVDVHLGCGLRYLDGALLARGHHFQRIL